MIETLKPGQQRQYHFFSSGLLPPWGGGCRLVDGYHLHIDEQIKPHDPIGTMGAGDLVRECG